MAYIGNSPANVGGYQIVDDISASFDGSTTSFALTASSSTITPVKTGQLLVGLNGVMQEPDDTGTDGFKVSGSNIVFSSAPTNGDTFWAVYQGQNVDVGTPSAGTVGAAELKNDAITNIKMADDAIGVAELSATGTASSSVFLRGDNSWATPTDTGLTDIVGDTTPQLGGMLDVNGNAIGDGTLELLKFSETASAVNEFTVANAATGNAPVLSATGGDADIGITLTPKGTGDVNLSADTVQVGDNNVDATITTQGTGDLILNTNSGTNAGNITLADGVNGNITITPNGTGEVSLTRPEIKDYSETVQAKSGGFTVNTATLNSGNVIHHSGGGIISFDTPGANYAGVSLTIICQTAPTISGTHVFWNDGTAPTTSGVCVYTFFCGITSGSTYKWFGVEVGKDFA